MICDGSFPTTQPLALDARPHARRQAADREDGAHADARHGRARSGLFDRGLLAPGYRADLNVIDYDRLALLGAAGRYDLPAWRAPR